MKVIHIKLVLLLAILCSNPAQAMLRRGARTAARSMEAVEKALFEARIKTKKPGHARAGFAATKEEAFVATKSAKLSVSPKGAPQPAKGIAHKAANSATKAPSIAEIAEWAKANPVKVVTMAGITTTGVTAYLCEEKINELTVEQFNKHTDEIYKKAEENKIIRTLVAYFIVGNFMNIDLDKIKNFVKKNSDAAKIIAIEAAKNLSSLMTTKGDLYTLGVIANGSPDAAKIIASEAAKNLRDLTTTVGG